MKKARMTRSKPAESRENRWLASPENASEEDVRDTARNEIIKALPALVRAMVQGARDGSVAHMKLLVQLERDLAKPEPQERQGKNLEQILMERWAKDAANKDVASKDAG